jgi:hypothetical protein
VAVERGADFLEQTPKPARLRRGFRARKGGYKPKRDASSYEERALIRAERAAMKARDKQPGRPWGKMI